MFIAMNRFKIRKGSEDAFEQVWASRESYLDQLPGFVEFHLLKGPEAEAQPLSSSPPNWETKAHFEGWTKSEQFRKAHERAGNSGPSPIMEHPKFEGFEVKLTQGRKGAAA